MAWRWSCSELFFPVTDSSVKIRWSLSNLKSFQWLLFLQVTSVIYSSGFINWFVFQRAKMLLFVSVLIPIAYPTEILFLLPYEPLFIPTHSWTSTPCNTGRQDMKNVGTIMLWGWIFVCCIQNWSRFVTSHSALPQKLCLPGSFDYSLRKYWLGFVVVVVIVFLFFFPVLFQRIQHLQSWWQNLLLQKALVQNTNM